MLKKTGSSGKSTNDPLQDNKSAGDEVVSGDLSTTVQINENTSLPLKLVWTLISVAVALAAFVLSLNFKLDAVEARSRGSQETLEAIQRDREIYMRDYYENMSIIKTDMKSVKESLDRINRKLDR